MRLGEGSNSHAEEEGEEEEREEKERRKGGEKELHTRRKLCHLAKIST